MTSRFSRRTMSTVRKFRVHPPPIVAHAKTTIFHLAVAESPHVPDNTPTPVAVLVKKDADGTSIVLARGTAPSLMVCAKAVY